MEGEVCVSGWVRGFIEFLFFLNEILRWVILYTVFGSGGWVLVLLELVLEVYFFRFTGVFEIF